MEIDSLELYVVQIDQHDKGDTMTSVILLKLLLKAIYESISPTRHISTLSVMGNVLFIGKAPVYTNITSVMEPDIL